MVMVVVTVLVMMMMMIAVMILLVMTVMMSVPLQQPHQPGQRRRDPEQLLRGQAVEERRAGDLPLLLRILFHPAAAGAVQ